MSRDVKLIVTLRDVDWVPPLLDLEGIGFEFHGWWLQDAFDVKLKIEGTLILTGLYT